MENRGLFVTGTSTEVGKTYVAAGIARALVAVGLSVGVYKPVASGCEQKNGTLVNADAVELWQAAGKPLTLAAVCPQTFAAPVAPHLAARQEGKEIDAMLLRSGLDPWKDFDVVIVEGAGGLMSPISDEEYVADLAIEFGFPLIVVAANTLGVINQTLQTLNTAATFREGMEVAGVVLNDVSQASHISQLTNLDELKSRCMAPILGHVGHNDAAILDNVDWSSFLGLRK